MNRHSVTKWKVEQKDEYWGDKARMAVNAFLCDRGRSYNVLLDVGFTTYTFQDNWIQPKGNR